jgi:polyhydroxybutyrate depolymerase
MSVLLSGCGSQLITTEDAGEGTDGPAVDAAPRAPAQATDAGLDASPGIDAAAVDNDPALPDPCQSGTRPQADSVWTITSGGRERTFRVHVPPSYNPATPTALVLNFHGVNCTSNQQILLSQMPQKSDAAGFIAVHPEGINKSWNGGTCCGTAMSEHIDDVAFTKALLDDVESKLCIDKRRIFATGISNGGYMTNRLGCELADRIAAIAPVAGGTLVFNCNPSRPVPVLYFHGTEDQIVPYQGGFMGGLPAASKTFTDWANRNGCTGSPVTTFTNGDVHCESYQTCSAGVEVTLCTIEGGGHTWPGGTPVPPLGVTTNDINANDAMWSFFERFPLP